MADRAQEQSRDAKTEIAESAVTPKWRHMRFRDTVPPLLASPSGAIVVFYTVHYIDDSSSLLAPTGVVIVYAYALVFALIFVMPLLLIVPRLRLLSWWATVIWGVLVGVAVAAVIRRPIGLDVVALKEADVLVSCAAAAAFVYWLIAEHSYRRRRRLAAAHDRA